MAESSDATEKGTQEANETSAPKSVGSLLTELASSDGNQRKGLLINLCSKKIEQRSAKPEKVRKKRAAQDSQSGPGDESEGRLRVKQEKDETVGRGARLGSGTFAWGERQLSRSSKPPWEPFPLSQLGWGPFGSYGPPGPWGQGFLDCGPPDSYVPPDSNVPPQTRDARSRSRKVAKDKGLSTRSDQPGETHKKIENSEKRPVADLKMQLWKMGEVCCTVTAEFVKGNEKPEKIKDRRLEINQRTKVEHCSAHLKKAGDLTTVWQLIAEDKSDQEAYDALCDYFVEKKRVGLVEAKAFFIYIVPPQASYQDQLSLPKSKFALALQVPTRKSKEGKEAKDIKQAKSTEW